MKTLKNTSLKIATLALSTLSIGAMAEAQVNRVTEIPLERVFVPRVGFDDNDNVQVFVEGMLPNSCYSLNTTEFSLVPSSNKIVLTQTAIHDESGICADEASLPPSLSQGIPFWRELNIGLLQSGNYRVIFSGGNGVSSRDFGVEPAPTTSVDSLRYAIVTNAFITDTVKGSDQEMEFRITGYLTSSCAELSDTNNIQKIDDMYVFLPSVVIREDICMPTNKPFYRVVKVRTPAPGHYLLHVRSQAGQSRSKPFQVTGE